MTARVISLKAYRLLGEVIDHMPKTGRGSYGSAPKEEMVEIACTIKHETASAWLVNDGIKDLWIPKSRCEVDEQAGTALIPEWLAKKEKLI